MYTAYVDASDAPHASGLAVVFDNRYIAVMVPRRGINRAELEAFKFAVKIIPQRPLHVVTDSKHVLAHAKAKGVTVEWRPRNSCYQLERADRLSKLAVHTGKRQLGGLSGDPTTSCEIDLGP